MRISDWSSDVCSSDLPKTCNQQTGGNQKMKRAFIAAVAACGLAAVALPAAAKDKLLIGASSASSSQYGYFVALSQLINSHVQNVDSSVVETGATVDNLRRIERKQIDLGLVTTNVGYQAYVGEGPFEGKKTDSRRLKR